MAPPPRPTFRFIPLAFSALEQSSCHCLYNQLQGMATVNKTERVTLRLTAAQKGLLDLAWEQPPTGRTGLAAPVVGGVSGARSRETVVG